MIDCRYHVSKIVSERYKETYYVVAMADAEEQFDPVPFTAEAILNIVCRY